MNSPSIHQLIEEQVLRTPDAIAVSYQDRHLTYHQLNQRANQLAHHLRSQGVKAEMLVGVCIERSLEMVVTLLGILKAGGAYIPLDPNYPQARLSLTIEDAQLPFLVTQSHLKDVVPQTRAKTVFVDQDSQLISQQSDQNITGLVADHNLAYVLYTSGSTGRPKGVAIEHRNVIALVDWASSFFTAEQLKGVLASTSLCFDLSIFELFVTLSCGGSVIVVQNALELSSSTPSAEVTLINTVPSAINELLKADCIPPSVTTVNLAGEPLQNALVQQLYGLSHIEKIFNLYGPSEDTTYSTACLMPRGTNDIPSIGQPISNTRIYLLDSNMNPVPSGNEGEMYISSPGLARGYLNRPDLTRQKFLSNPLSAAPESRLYKTGDLASYDSSGNLKFLGRIDHQVKIRGFRIELGEIESCLLQHYAVNQVIVVAREAKEGEQGNKRIVAYFVPNTLANNQNTLSKNTLARVLRDFLSQKLPDYMIPSAFISLEHLPLTPNGKIDRRALPVPVWTRSALGDYVAPKTLTERKIVDIWSELLSVEAEKIGIHDAFEELGGNSLLSVQAVSEINEKLRTNLSLGDFLKEPTVDSLSRRIEAIAHTQGAESLAYDLENETNLDPTIIPQPALNGPIPEILLTGATGFLGVFLLHELLRKTRADVHCLVRATSFEEGKAKLWNQLKAHCLWEEGLCDRIIPIIGDLGQPNLGLTTEKFFRLSEKIDTIYHCGAWVNVVYPYEALRAANVTGTEEILKLACQNRIKPVHFISTVDVYASDKDIVTGSEQDEIGPVSRLYSGYAQSKYVAEKLVASAGKRGLPVAIYRPSNILGTYKTGILSVDSFIPKLLQGCLQMGCTPEIEALLNIITVDYASQVIVKLSQQHDSYGQAMNIVNPHSITWTKLLDLMEGLGYSMKRLSYESWYGHLLKIKKQGSQNAVMPLAALFSNRQFIRKSLGAFDFVCENTQRRITEAGVVCPSFDTPQLENYLAHMACLEGLRPQSSARELKKIAKH
ncbi:amino acid adenylation domain-containing protein [cf. Phormidesmis sp. LEGE 11477]|uniref:amino acid adenylation domain-containing protein n=1 Tax=cf. Phormidesmis sp. LEGE 11477 TaxID=1828680 RepID=UPI00187EA32F|nr:amino acid adenylation domain-containing protein [cf. Phormidesmis sp. LEGE 11477]MBE9060601.1 amino acid adenylation domain-containing protein [cf. Phormidesmis sp. LEGE 11477]